MYKFVITFFILPSILNGQELNLQRDTSFTVYSAFAKEHKNHPFIKIAQPPLPDHVNSQLNVAYATIGARKLHLDIFYPAEKNAKPYPGIILIHGGGWRSGDKSQAVPMAQQLASRGYVAAAVEYRLSTEALYPASVYDLKASIRWMRANAARYNMDESLIASLGFSSGGQIAALIGTTNGVKKFEGDCGYPEQSSDVQAIIDIDGILAFKHPESEEGTVAALWLGGTYEQKPLVWQEASALYNTNSNTAPALFINSALPRFHAGRDDMIKKMDSLKIYSEVHTLPDTPHPFWLFDPWFDKTVVFAAGFLKKVFGK